MTTKSVKKTLFIDGAADVAKHLSRGGAIKIFNGPHVFFTHFIYMTGSGAMGHNRAEINIMVYDL